MKLKGLQVLEKRGFKKWLVVTAAQLSEVFDVVNVETETIHDVDDIGESATDAKPTTKRVATKEKIKDGFLAPDLRLPIRIGHGQLIEVGQHRQRLLIDMN